MAKVQPLADRIVAQAEEASDKTASGFYLPEDAKEKPQMAKVVTVGKDVSEVKKDDTIVYPKYGTTEVTIEGTEYMILKEEDVLGIVK
ncbi:co-chaperone GroES [Candidatus Saccharibacteria bacterium QS_5_54_17]|nr:MAG: co-chaperone GroES [Candidatus Saccharibacteria bacterium QS_5_54_17]PSO43999.1 MAG: co-chaperone GroES [Candidatus Saccharibacteria bacterium SW_7_54_9]